MLFGYSFAVRLSYLCVLKYYNLFIIYLLQAAYKMTSPTGGRVTVFQHTLPTIGPGAVSQREVQTNDKKADASLLGPQTDFYKKLALDCSGQQVAVDVWTLSGSYVDLATLSGMFFFYILTSNILLG